jgi:hypothetical protein
VKPIGWWWHVRQEVARYIEGASRSLGQRQAQEAALQAGLQDARKALGEQASMLSAVGALKAQLASLRQGLQAQACTPLHPFPHFLYLPAGRRMHCMLTPGSRALSARLPVHPAATPL